jgi:hypothetical protein
LLSPTLISPAALRDDALSLSRRTQSDCHFSLIDAIISRRHFHFIRRCFAAAFPPFHCFFADLFFTMRFIIISCSLP